MVLAAMIEPSACMKPSGQHAVESHEHTRHFSGFFLHGCIPASRVAGSRRVAGGPGGFCAGSLAGEPVFPDRVACTIEVSHTDVGRRRMTEVEHGALNRLRKFDPRSG